MWLQKFTEQMKNFQSYFSYQKSFMNFFAIKPIDKIKIFIVFPNLEAQDIFDNCLFWEDIKKRFLMNLLKKDPHVGNTLCQKQVYRKVYDPFVGASKTEFDFSKQGGSKPFSKNNNFLKMSKVKRIFILPIGLIGSVVSEITYRFWDTLYIVNFQVHICLQVTFLVLYVCTG